MSSFVLFSILRNLFYLKQGGCCLIIQHFCCSKVGKEIPNIVSEEWEWNAFSCIYLGRFLAMAIRFGSKYYLMKVKP